MESSSSSSPFVTFTFRLVCIVCCIIAVTSLGIGYGHSNQDRNERAVTEWRFRRNYLLHYPYVVPVHSKTSVIKDSGHNYNQADEPKLHKKKFVIPQLIHTRSEPKNND